MGRGLGGKGAGNMGPGGQGLGSGEGEPSRGVQGRRLMGSGRAEVVWVGALTGCCAVLCWGGRGRSGVCYLGMSH